MLQSLPKHSLQADNKPDSDLADHSHEHHCAVCKDHTHAEENHDVVSLTKKLHKENGHTCTDTNCHIHEPHGHISHNLKPLESLITESKLPPVAKQLLINISNLLPALSAYELTHAAGASPLISAPAAIVAMHLLNRGTAKLWRLASTIGTSILAQLARRIHLPKFLIRSLAAAGIYLIEQPELLHNPSKQKDLLSKLIRLETQINLVPSLSTKISTTLSSNKFIQTLLKVISMSGGFVAFHKLWDCFSSNKDNGQNLNISNAANLVQACGCCAGAPFCITEVVSEAALPALV